MSDQKISNSSSSRFGMDVFQDEEQEIKTVQELLTELSNFQISADATNKKVKDISENFVKQKKDDPVILENIACDLEQTISDVLMLKSKFKYLLAHTINLQAKFDPTHIGRHAGLIKKVFGPEGDIEESPDSHSDDDDSSKQVQPSTHSD